MILLSTPERQQRWVYLDAVTSHRVAVAGIDDHGRIPEP